MEKKMEKMNEKDCCNAAVQGGVKGYIGYIIIGLLSALLVVSVIQLFQINSFNLPVASVSGASVVDTSDWSENEKMMYEHHGTLPARLQSNVNSVKQLPSMVGGC